MKGLYERVMMSNMLADEGRFRQIVDGAISDGTVEAFPVYLNETDKQKERRRKQALKEQQEAEEHAKDLGIHSRVYEVDSKENEVLLQRSKEAATSSECNLAALIQQRVKGRMENFVEKLEEKYATKPKKGGRGKKTGAVILDEPSGKAFEAMAKRSPKGMTKGDELVPEVPMTITGRGKKRSAEVSESEPAQEGKGPRAVDEDGKIASTRKRKKRQKARKRSFVAD